MILSSNEKLAGLLAGGRGQRIAKFVCDAQFVWFPFPFPLPFPLPFFGMMFMRNAPPSV